MAEHRLKWLTDIIGGGGDKSEKEESVGPIYPTPDGKPISSSAADVTSLQPVKNWSHPFKQKNKVSAIDQLTQLANATAGYYPLGAGGLWHGGVHFDSGTAGVLDQSSVVCIADGEVVAYRIDMNSSVTSYVQNKKPMPKPFSRNFVLVRHRIEAPIIQGGDNAPPSLIIYSLYMHLEDGAVYQNTPTLTRPQFWEKKDDYIVPMSAKDAGPNLPERLGINVRHQEKRGSVIDLLPQGVLVRVSGEGAFRRLQNTMGPARLLDADGALLGYVRFDQLEPVEGGEYRAKAGLTIYEEINSKRSLRKPDLPKGTQVKISGEGELRKLERIAQFVHFDSLQALPVPRAYDEICVLDKPLPIKAGALIGHIGQYQDYAAAQPEKKLHLEVFSDGDVERFIEQCRSWEKGLPAKDRTWLKLAKGTIVVAHKDHFGEKRPPTLNDENQLSGADLFVPKSLLDGLPSSHKIEVSEAGERKACNWYRLEGLLNNVTNQLLDGWVRVEKSVEQWTSPWAWEGYEVITDYTSPPEFMAASLRSLKRLTDEQLRRYGPMADAGDEGPIKERLFELIDSDEDKNITAEKLRAVMRIPAHAQALSRSIIYCESEWYYRPQKWDVLDEILGHVGSTPHINWLAEKERIRELSWWSDTAGMVGISSEGVVHHFHSIGLLNNFSNKSSCACGTGLGAIYSTVSYGRENPQYGPSYSGGIGLKDYEGWRGLVSSGEVSGDERDILVAMSENEGNLDALQSYDSEILSVGAMQKTINPRGAGELPQQVYEFKCEHPDMYERLFFRCGWEVREERGVQYLYYDGVTGADLKKILREGFNAEAKRLGRKLPSKPLAVFSNAIVSEEFMAKQVTDFVRRLRLAVSLYPSGYPGFSINQYLKTKIGKAAVLDQHVNRPGYVRADFGSALKKFFSQYPHVSEVPTEWGDAHEKHEGNLLEVYVSVRRMTNSEKRYNDLKAKL